MTKETYYRYSLSKRISDIGKSRCQEVMIQESYDIANMKNEITQMKRYTGKLDPRKNKCKCNPKMYVTDLMTSGIS